ncbi:SPFH and helix-turn-helix domain-containing protein [Vandammella animalimorsus]|uniref:DNA-binding protein n=1 Tax=Vandammella animalimorsus TaxID=2029117 RepID=A0A2A2B084_9BURK|nr:SPFH and helix-turn-helix domain-containing protein [Vandammella animalimorsus]PAT43342.1 DNA-binding protein [Vandammella animalimorsus]
MDRIWNLVRNQLIEVIEWTDDSRDTLSYRWPDEDKEIKNGAQLIVRESQMVQFVAAGQFADLFGPGKHTLTTENIPILSTILGWKYGFQSPFKCDVYYLNTRLFTGNKWGTSNPVMMRDQDFGVVRLRAFGTYDFRIVDAPRFLKEVAGTDQNFRLDEFNDTMRSRIVSVFTEALAKAHVPVLDIAQRYAELGDALLPIINPVIRDKYGLEVSSFILENVSVPPEVEQAIDKRSSMSVIGNLNDYVKYQMGQAMGQGGEAGAAATMPAQMAMGFGMAQEMMKSMQQPQHAPAAGMAAAGAVQGVAGAGALDVLTPEQAAQALGVSVEDVMASIEAGDLKARKIGSAWRIARGALEEFLRG